MDYCTLWFEGWWSHCCEAHDADYAAQIGQALADERLMSCVASALPDLAVQHPILAGAFGVASATVGGLMFIGVRIFGRRFYRKASTSD